MRRLKYSQVCRGSSCRTGASSGLGLLLWLVQALFPLAHAGPLLEAYERARVDDPTYRSAQRQAEAAAESLEQARALWRPGVSVNAAAGPSRQDVRQSPGQNGLSTYRTGQFDYRAREYSLQLSQALYNAGHVAGGEQAEARQRQMQAELRSQEQDLILRVAERYLGATAQFESLGALEAEVDSLTRHARDVGRRREAGLVRRSDLLEAESRLGEVEARRVEARIRFVDALRSLEEVSGWPLEKLGLLGGRGLPGAPEPADPAYWSEQAARHHPLIEARRQALAVAEFEVRRQASAHQPTLDFALRAGRNYASDSLYGGPSDIANHDLRLNLSLPVYSGGMVSSREREAVKMVERAAEDLRAQERSVERSVRGSYDRIGGASARIESLLRSQRLIEEGLRIKRTAYASGLVPGLAVIDAERDLHAVRSELARARYDFMLGLINLKRAAGLLEESDLRAIDVFLDQEIGLATARPGP